MAVVKATINLQALKHNLSQVKKRAPQCKVMSVIKANAYGHGVLPVAKALSESDAYAVARFDEALFLRQQEVQKKIVILGGVYSREDFLVCIDQHFEPVLHTLEQIQCLFDTLQWLGSKGEQKSFDYWLKVDTGMHRLGLSADELNGLSHQYQTLTARFSPSGFMSHFACADEIDNKLNQVQNLKFLQQYESFSKVNNSDKLSLSMANSAAILSLPDAHYDWLRPGIMLYGVSPFAGRTGKDENLLPVMTLSSQLIAIKQLKQGDCIGYGASWCCPKAMTIGVIAIGYGDGYPRHAKAGTPVLIQGAEVPLVGRVSMDMITVDLSPLQAQEKTAQVGDNAILWGDGLPIEYVSHQADTIAYELLCQITPRVSFEYK
ncbi:alanine racemase [sulfur-oxidizing endosymbiont of Gigantopelta aegis]|uniref:alanine racemase n=1 Tax=sulfur-oxidizing endosymbiont of Gigantopelta aegis TaxID=2794934 RepID=UPI0018DEAEF0|nr:alanine racemase [sulfur-oxidizing endosymbiont of Gigantopelta aegis]